MFSLKLYFPLFCFLSPLRAEWKTKIEINLNLAKKRFWLSEFSFHFNFDKLGCFLTCKFKLTRYKYNFWSTRLFGWYITKKKVVLSVFLCKSPIRTLLEKWRQIFTLFRRLITRASLFEVIKCKHNFEY